MMYVQPDKMFDQPNELNVELDDVEFLKRGLLLGEGFQLYLVNVNTIDDREGLIHELSTTKGLVTTTVEGAGLNDRSLVTAILDSFSTLSHSEEYPVVVVSEIDELVAEEPRLLSRLNEQRNELTVQSTGAVVILGSMELIQRLRNAAPDAWSIRAADLEYTGQHTTKHSVEVDKPRLSPIKPPTTSGEHRKLHSQLNKLPPGDERGRVALRLAEICDFEGYSRTHIASLYNEAAEHISDSWLSTLARINAARAQTGAGRFEEARSSIKKINEVIESFGPDFKAYFYQSLADLEFAEGNIPDAFNYVRSAIQYAHKSGDLDLLSEARLMHANLHCRSGNPQNSINEAKTAEQDAIRSGDLQLVQRTRTLLGKVAVSAGHLRQARAAWLRYLNQFKKIDEVSFRQLLHNIDDLDRNDKNVSAEKGWDIIRGLAEEKGIVSLLIKDIVYFIFEQVLWSREEVNIAIWLERLNSIKDEQTTELLQAIMNLSKAREALKNQDIQTASSSLHNWNSIAEEHSLDPFIETIGYLTWASCLIMEKRFSEALKTLTQIFMNKERTRLAFKYFAMQAKEADKVENLPFPDFVLIELLIKWIGGVESAVNIVDLLTGCNTGKEVEDFLSLFGDRRDYKLKVENPYTTIPPNAHVL